MIGRTVRVIRFHSLVSFTGITGWTLSTQDVIAGAGGDGGVVLERQTDQIRDRVLRLLGEVFGGGRGGGLAGVDQGRQLGGCGGLDGRLIVLRGEDAGGEIEFDAFLAGRAIRVGALNPDESAERGESEQESMHQEPPGRDARGG